MSTFKGRMMIYTNVALDRFDGLNLRCTAFFLSHCHKDHMVGLDDKKFENALKSRPGVFLYCTEITRLLLLADEEYMSLEPYLRTLQVGTEQLIKIPKDSSEKGHYDVKVTAVSAGHCPGSAMFLFEGDQGTSLYTGDFRWEMNYASTVSAFGTSQKPKAIDHLHIDTTFCVPQARHIPSRVECAEVTVSVVAQWLGRSPKHQVAFFCPARYGYEFLLREVAMRLDTKIHVSSLKVHLYDQIPDLAGLFTSDPLRARVHACSGKMRKNPSLYPPCSTNHIPILGEGNPTERNLVLNIRPCAMWFTAKTNRAGLEKLKHVPALPNGLQRVCYSMHSSYSEIQGLVSYLQPQHVWPNVIPTSVKSPNQVQAHLDSFLEHSHPLRPNIDRPMEKKSSRVDTNTNEPQTKPSFFSLLAQDSDGSGSCCFSSQEDPEPEPLTNADPTGVNTTLEQDQQPCWSVEEEDVDPWSDEENAVKGTEDREDAEGELNINDQNLHLSLSEHSEELSEPHGFNFSPSLPCHNYESLGNFDTGKVMDDMGVKPNLDGDIIEADKSSSSSVIEGKGTNIFNIFTEKSTQEGVCMDGTNSYVVLDGHRISADNSDITNCSILGSKMDTNPSYRSSIGCDKLLSKNCLKGTSGQANAGKGCVSVRERNVKPKGPDMGDTLDDKEGDDEESVKQKSLANHKQSEGESDIIQSSPTSKAKKQGILLRGKVCKRPMSPVIQSPQTCKISGQYSLDKSTSLSVNILPSSISSTDEPVSNQSTSKKRSIIMTESEVAAQFSVSNQNEQVATKRQRYEPENLIVRNRAASSSCKVESVAVEVDQHIPSGPVVISDDSSADEDQDSDKLLQPQSQREKGNSLSGWMSKEKAYQARMNVVDLTGDS